jgi:hypothetical protein
VPPEQTYRNHRRIVPGYHIAASFFILAYLIWVVRDLVRHPGLGSAMQVVFVVGVALLFWYARVFPMTVQDRLIRLEERLRLQRLLPPDLQGRIEEFTVGQLVGLRFASDGELPALARKVLEQNIRDREVVKRMIVTWRADNLRA